MRHGEECDRQSAGVMCTARCQRCLETVLACHAGKEVIPADRIRQRAGPGLERSDGMAIIDDMGGTRADPVVLAWHRQTVVCAETERDPVSMDARCPPMANQSGGDRTKDPPPREAPGGRPPHTHLLTLGVAAGRQRLEMLDRDRDRLVMTGIDSANDPIDEGS